MVKEIIKLLRKTVGHFNGTMLEKRTRSEQVKILQIKIPYMIDIGSFVMKKTKLNIRLYTALTEKCLNVVK